MSSGRECHLFHFFYQETKTTEALQKTWKETDVKEFIVIGLISKDREPRTSL